MTSILRTVGSSSAAWLIAVVVTSANAETTSMLIKRELEVTDASIATCHYADGRPIDEVRCADWQRTLAKAYAEEAKVQLHTDELKKATEQFAKDRAIEIEREAQRQLEWEAERVKRQADSAARERVHAKQHAAEEAREAAADKRAAQAEVVKKDRCGIDYKKPSIGMTMARVRECVSPSFKLSGQVNTAQGIVTTYKAPGGYLHVIDDKVVQWGYFRQ